MKNIQVCIVILKIGIIITQDSPTNSFDNWKISKITHITFSNIFEVRIRSDQIEAPVHGHRS